MVKVTDRVHIITPRMPAPGFAQLCDACLEHPEGMTLGGATLIQEFEAGSEIDGCSTMAIPLEPGEIGPHECLLTEAQDPLTE